MDSQLAAILSGLGVLLPASIATRVGQAFHPTELLRLLGGTCEIDAGVLEDWRKNTVYGVGLRADDELSNWFWYEWSLAALEGFVILRNTDQSTAD